MSTEQKSPAKQPANSTETTISDAASPKEKSDEKLPPEYGGRKGAEATRFGDWELNGKCVDF